MANELLIQAIRSKGLDIIEVADIAGADPRTVQRWLGGRVPHPRYRQKLAEALELEEQELWAETVRVRRKTGLLEIVAAAPRRGDADAPDWRALLRDAREQIDMLGYSLHFVTSARQIGKLLAGKAQAGCPIRIALADPALPAMLDADERERPPGRLVGRVQASKATLLTLAEQSLIELREHQVATSHTILRFDDTMLLTVHVYGTPGFQAPVLKLHREYDYGVFDQLAKHFEDVWQSARPLGVLSSDGAAPSEGAVAGGGDVSVEPSADEKAEAEKRRLLESLDYVYRPPS